MSAALSADGRQPRWPLGYRPLGGRTLLLQLTILAAGELALYDAYRGEQAGVHWTVHLLVGLTAAAVWNLGVLLVKAAPARGQLISILVFHVYAIFPDLLFDAGAPHARSMDVFLGHLSVHYLPGGERSWLAIGLASFGIYVVVLTAWLAARRREAELGMAPGIGIGGLAVVRPQHDPETTPLAQLRFGPEKPPEVMLLHGLGASANIWTSVGRRLACQGTSVLAPDLLGFGRSRRIGTRFTLDEQVASLERLLERSGAGPVEIVAHSAGCVVAVALAAAHPERMRRLALVSPPAFADPELARRRLARRSALARATLAGGPLASIACGLMCLGRGLLGRAAPWLARDLPPEVARDGLQHSWPAYRDMLVSLFDANPLVPWLEHPRAETVVVVADRDETTPAADVLDRRYEAVRVVGVQGNHLLPVAAPDALLDAVAKAQQASLGRVDG